jgi:hypothetical protein
VLDGSSKSSIESKAALTASQLLNISLKAGREEADKQPAKTKRESRLLDKDLKAADNSASVLITARRRKQRFVSQAL